MCDCVQAKPVVGTAGVHRSSSSVGSFLRQLGCAGLITPAIVAACGLQMASAGQLPASAFQPYNITQAGTIVPGPFALFTVNVGSLHPTQINEGFTEVGKKQAGFDLLTPAQLAPNLLTAIEPVVIGPGGQLFITDGHHTFTALADSIYGVSMPTVDVNVIANYSNLTTAQFYAQLQAANLLFPVNDGVLQTVNPTTGAPLPTTLTGLTSDVYRGLEYSILKNKSSVLFPTAANITGSVGSAIPGLDKTAAFYSDFILADAYRGANNGLGLPYLSPGDIATATKWNLTGTNQTSLPNFGPITVSQIPGYILPTGGSINITGPITNATLANGVLDGSKTGTFNQTGGANSASFAGLRGLNLGTVTIGSNAPGFVMQLGADNKAMVTLSGANTYTGGTTILAGTLAINGDAALGAAATGGATPINATQIQAQNGIVFDSLTEGAGTLQIAANVGTPAAPLVLSRAIGVGGETATLDLNGNSVSLTGPLVSVGTGGVGIGNATGNSDFTINDSSGAANGVLTLAPSSGGNPLFYGNTLITAGTLRVSSDASLGNVTGPAYSIGQIDLNGGTLQAGASFNSVRSLFLDSGSTVDTNGFTTTFARGIVGHAARPYRHQQRRRDGGRLQTRRPDHRLRRDARRERRLGRNLDDRRSRQRHHAKRGGDPAAATCQRHARRPGEGDVHAGADLGEQRLARLDRHR